MALLGRAIEPYFRRQRPVPDATTPAFGMLRAGGLVDPGAMGENGVVGARMTLRGTHKFPVAMLVVVIIPAHEGGHPGSRLCEASEGARIAGAVFAGAKQALGIGVVVGDPGTATRTWEGFQVAVPSETNLVGVRIRQASSIKLFRFERHPILRGTALCQSERTGYLWTKGYIP